MSEDGQGWVRKAGDCSGWSGMGENSGNLWGTVRDGIRVVS